MQIEVWIDLFCKENCLLVIEVVWNLAIKVQFSSIIVRRRTLRRYACNINYRRR
eukprot:XP_001709484.1 Hypothetical protein GL50803_38817 [Giardia lamblia ATCC 50803]